MRGLYALPPGADFAGDFVAGLCARFGDRPPEALAGVTLYLNSAATLRAVRAAFDRHGPLLLPRLRLIADLGGGARVPPLARMLDLAQLIGAAGRLDPGLIAGQSLPALAQSLAALMAEMQLEGCAPQALDGIDVGQHAAHWQRALTFLRIAARAHLDPDGPPLDREARQRAAAEALATAWAEGRDLPQGPVIVAGSTGSHGATRLFLRAVAGLAQGAVVLPGYDFDQPHTVWAQLQAAPADEHPQARFAPLIADLGPPRLWVAQPARPRGRLVSLALRPAPVTDQWVAEGPALGDLVAATEGLSLIEADQPQAEAEAIAIAMREAVEAGRPVTLIAADRGLTRRVTAALDRWRLIPDDSAGRPLALSQTGLLLRAIAALPGRPCAVDALLVLLKNRRTAGGDRQGEHLRQTRDLELHLRARGPAFPDANFLHHWGAANAERAEWAGWLAAILDRITPLAQDRDARPLPDRLAELRALAEALAAGPGGDAARLWADEAGQLARATLDGLVRAAQPGHRLLAHDFASLITQRLQAQALRSTPGAHPLIRIRGPREARTDATGLVILGGLNEGGWPQPAPPDPWLSRAMRLQAGLTLPERQIGLAAHDFQQGLAATQVILTRARRDAEAETVPSRWLNRLLNLLAGLPEQGGRQALEGMRARGHRWLALATQLAEPRPEIRAANPPQPRPAPIPPAGALTEISVTQVARLIRDPYAVYAQKLLRLRPLNPLQPRPDDPRLRGILLHGIAEAITRGIAEIGPDPAALEAHIRAIAARALADLIPWPAERAFLAARLDAIAPQLATDDAARLRVQQPVVIERAGGAALPRAQVRLTARPDRLDRGTDGRVWVFDYKSGRLPTDREIAAFDKQLPLTAALVARGAFDGLGPAPLAGAAYIRLGGDGATQIRDVTTETAAEAWARLDDLLAGYQAGTRGFTAMRALQSTRDRSDYAHLARFGEWTLADAPVEIPVEIPDGPDEAPA